MCAIDFSLTRNHQEVCPRKFFSNKVESIEKKYIRNTYLFVFTQKFQRAVFFGLKILKNKVKNVQKKYHPMRGSNPILLSKKFLYISSASNDVEIIQNFEIAHLLTILC